MCVRAGICHCQKQPLRLAPWPIFPMQSHWISREFFEFRSTYVISERSQIDSNTRRNQASRRAHSRFINKIEKHISSECGCVWKLRQKAEALRPHTRAHTHTQGGNDTADWQSGVGPEMLAGCGSNAKNHLLCRWLRYSFMFRACVRVWHSWQFIFPELVHY